MEELKKLEVSQGCNAPDADKSDYLDAFKDIVTEKGNRNIYHMGLRYVEEIGLDWDAMMRHKDELLRCLLDYVVKHKK